MNPSQPSEGSEPLEMPVMPGLDFYIAALVASAPPGVLISLTGGDDIPVEGELADLRFQVPKVQHLDGHPVQDPPNAGQAETGDVR